jgi:4-hydroxy-tetrahydrodipicolinate reductase
MIKTILLVGNGKLSKSLQKYLLNYKTIIFTKNNIENINEYNGDLLIDCSTKDAFNDIYNYLITRPTKSIICSTGHSLEQIEKIKSLSAKCAILKSENFSLGIALLNKIIRENSKLINQFDLFLTDYHHKDKTDSPSGTSLKLSTQLDNVHHLSIRSKSIIGEHRLELIDDFEDIKIIHKVNNRDLFAKGIIKSINFIDNKEIGFYQMEDLINEIQ